MSRRWASRTWSVLAGGDPRPRSRASDNQRGRGTGADLRPRCLLGWCAALCLALPIALAGFSSRAEASPAGTVERQQIRGLVESYYGAVERESVEQLLQLYHFADPAAREATAEQARHAFGMADSVFHAISIGEIELHHAEGRGVAFVDVEYELSRFDHADSMRGRMEAAFVLVTSPTGWRIGKVGRAADLSFAAGAAEFARKAAGLGEAPAPAAGSPPSSQTPSFYAVRKSDSGDCVVVFGAPSTGDVVLGQFSSYAAAKSAADAGCVGSAGGGPAAGPGPAEGTRRPAGAGAAGRPGGSTHPPPPAPLARGSGGPKLTEARLLDPDDIVKRGAYGGASRLKDANGHVKAREPGIVIEDGFLAHPGGGGPSEIVYSHDGSREVLHGIAAVVDCLDYCGRNGSVEFRITGDGRELWSSGVVRHGDPAVRFAVSLAGVTELRLITNDGGDNINEDWAGWINLGLLGGSVIEPSDPPPGDEPGTTSTGAMTLSPVADAGVYAYSYRNWHVANSGGHTSCAAGWHPTGGEKRCYMRFDLPPVERVQRATLILHMNHVEGDGSRALQVHAVHEPWREGRDVYHSGQRERPAAPGEISWAQRPRHTVDPQTSFHPGAYPATLVRVDLTGLVNHWLGGRLDNNGLVIKGGGDLGGEHMYQFDSREAGDRAVRPRLELVVDSVGNTPAGIGKDEVLSLCSPDRQIVRSLYKMVLARDPSQEEMQSHFQRLSGGALRQHYVQYFLFSPEYEDRARSPEQFARDAARVILGRKASAGEVEAWSQFGRKELALRLLQSEEHLARTSACAGLWRRQTADTDETDADEREPEPAQSARSQQAYEAAVKAYNTLTDLMAKGEGETPAGQAAYEAYLRAKKKYEAILEEDE